MAPVTIAAAARAAGPSWVHAKVCSPEPVAHDGIPFDASICRLGLAPMADPEAASRAIHRVATGRAVRRHRAGAG
jgi:hypothetical protein